jgi:hypothetical protein
MPNFFSHDFNEKRLSLVCSIIEKVRGAENASAPL